MRHRVRAAALLCDGERLLLVEHRTPPNGPVWWVPPGGGVEPVDESIFACAKRETREETGLDVELSHIAYVREFLEPARSTRHLELFLVATSWSGTLTLDNLPPDEPDKDLVTNVRWLTRAELEDVYVWPEELRTHFWDDYAAGFPQLRYLGMQRAWEGTEE